MQEKKVEVGILGMLSRSSLVVSLVLRCAFFVIFTFVLAQVIDLGTSPTFIAVGSILGVGLGARSALSRLRFLGFSGILLSIFALYRGALWVVSLFTLRQIPTVFSAYHLTLHCDLFFLGLATAAISTWAFLRLRHVLTLEALILCMTCIYLLSGHRNFHFDMPKIVNTLAWTFRVQHLSMLVIMGIALGAVVLAYLFFASLAVRSLRKGKLQVVESDRGHFRYAASALFLGLAGVIFYFVSAEVYDYYDIASLTRTANGVGQENREGLSPLGFHSALGSTNQPAALVRLEGDYSQNPFTPMLYFRESALSEFNGHEIVRAAKEYDTDIADVGPAQAFTGKEDAELQERTPLVQSIYLLTDHKDAFAVDYPLSLVQLKNPNPSRFKVAYRAYSVAPAFPPGELYTASVGDPRWSEETKKHYLVTHADPRYGNLAKEITKDAGTDMEKVHAITNYLSKTAIYTLTPNHDVQNDDDPVAPFLFGDHRGYCVHFAHATVYMLRSLGIPSRIGTGYLTDLSQAKDGHILLRMGDRHAWAEVYIKGRGWIPFDIQPEKVESHAELQVDMKLLEELMGMIDPGEEMLPKDVLKGEKNIDEPSPFHLPDPRFFGQILGALIILLAALKLFLRFGYLLPGSIYFRLRRSYVSLVSSIYDLGYRRSKGETREEFRARMSREFGFDSLRITQALNLARYAPEEALSLSADELSALHKGGTDALAKVPLWRRALAFLNPLSVIAYISGKKW